MIYLVSLGALEDLIRDCYATNAGEVETIVRKYATTHCFEVSRVRVDLPNLTVSLFEPDGYEITYTIHKLEKV